MFRLRVRRSILLDLIPSFRPEHVRMFPVAETATGVRLQILVVGELGADELLPGGRVVVLVLGDAHQAEGVGAHHAAPLLQPALVLQKVPSEGS